MRKMGKRYLIQKILVDDNGLLIRKDSVFSVNSRHPENDPKNKPIVKHVIAKIALKHCAKLPGSVLSEEKYKNTEMKIMSRINSKKYKK